MTRIQASPRSEALLQPRELSYNCMKTFEPLFKKQLHLFTSSKRVFAEQLLLEVNNPMPTGCFYLPFPHPQSFDLGRCFLVNTKSSTPVARGFSCLPTLTNPGLTDAPSHSWANKKNCEINNCGFTKVGVFSWMEVKWHTTTTKQLRKKHRFLEVQKYFGYSSPQKRCSTVPLCLVRGKG